MYITKTVHLWNSYSAKCYEYKNSEGREKKSM